MELSTGRIIFTFSEFLTKDLKGRHPRFEQVTVLKQNPVSLSLSSLDHLSCNSFLSLSEAFVVETVIEVHFMSELEDLLSRISSLAQNKNDGGPIV